VRKVKKRGKGSGGTQDPQLWGEACPAAGHQEGKSPVPRVSHCPATRASCLLVLVSSATVTPEEGEGISRGPCLSAELRAGGGRALSSVCWGCGWALQEGNNPMVMTLPGSLPSSLRAAQ
jgi:hypothetical protein